MAGKPWDEAEEKLCKKMLNEGSSITEISRALSRTTASVDCKITREQWTRAAIKQNKDQQDTWAESGDSAQAVCTTHENSLESLLKQLKVDIDIWEVDKWVGNRWQMGYVAEGEAGAKDLWQIKAWFKRKRGWNPHEFKEKLLEQMQQLAKQNWPVKKYDNNSGVLAWLSIYDHHWGKLAWQPETGSNYDVSIASKRFNTAADDLLGRARKWKPERIGIVAGQDALHVDQGRKGQTNRDTPQDTDGRWQKAFLAAQQCYIRTIDIALKTAPVTIVCRPGNHDEEKMWCLGQVLQAHYSHNPNVEVINRPALWDSYRWGCVLLYVGHFAEMSDTRKKELPQDMAKDCGKDFYETWWHEIHCGHIHQEKETKWLYRTSETRHMTVLRFLPSLSGTDRWHAGKGYFSPMAAECHLYDKDRGRLGYLTHCITGDA